MNAKDHVFSFNNYRIRYICVVGNKYDVKLKATNLHNCKNFLYEFTLENGLVPKPVEITFIFI